MTLRECDEVSFGIGNCEIRVRFPRLVWLDSVSNKIASELRDIVGSEGDTLNPIRGI